MGQRSASEIASSSCAMAFSSIIFINPPLLKADSGHDRTGTSAQQWDGDKTLKMMEKGTGGIRSPLGTCEVVVIRRSRKRNSSMPVHSSSKIQFGGNPGRGPGGLAPGERCRCGTRMKPQHRHFLGEVHSPGLFKASPKCLYCPPIDDRFMISENPVFSQFVIVL